MFIVHDEGFQSQGALRVIRGLNSEVPVLEWFRGVGVTIQIKVN
jgi:hypothetical protein